MGLFIDEIGLSTAQGGLVLSSEIVIAGVVALLVTQLLSKISCLRLAIVGVTIIAIGQLGTIFSMGMSSIMLSRAFVGIGAGVIYAAANAAASQSSQPERLLGIAMGVSLIGFALTMPIIGYAIDWKGITGASIATIILIVLVLPVLRLLPNQPIHMTSDVVKGKDIGWLLKIGLLLSVVCFSIAAGATWSFSERIGNDLGFTGGTIGLLLGVGTVCGIAGTALAAWVGSGFRKSVVISIGLAAIAISCVLVMTAKLAVIYIIGIILYWVSYMFLYPIMIAIGAGLDPSGRTAATVGGVIVLSMGTAPFVGGLIIANSSFVTLGWAAFSTCLIAIFLILPITRSLDRQASA